jgi:hypothetical protein
MRVQLIELGVVLLEIDAHGLRSNSLSRRERELV